MTGNDGKMLSQAKPGLVPFVSFGQTMKNEKAR
jgi:hypothetical protein